MIHTLDGLQTLSPSGEFSSLVQDFQQGQVYGVTWCGEETILK